MGFESFSPFQKKTGRGSPENQQDIVVENESEVYKQAKSRLLEIFKSTDKEEIAEVYTEIRLFAVVFEINPEPIIETITLALRQNDPAIFLNETFRVLKPLLDKREEHPRIFERIRRERIMQNEGNVRLSELLYYNVDLGNNTAHLHVAPKGDLGFGNIIKSFRQGIKELAKHVQEDDKIKEIQATSWIVAANPGLLEKAGFTVVGPIDEKTKKEHFDSEERPISLASISRERLLEKWSQRDTTEKRELQ